MRNLVLIIVYCGIAIHGALAGVRQTPEAVALNHVRNAMSAYSKGYGRIPSKWEEVGQIIILEDENRAVTGTYGYRIQDRYQFITQPMAVPADEDLKYLGSRVLLIRTVPLTYKRKDTGTTTLRRYLVYQDKAGNILNMDMPEKRVQAMLAKSGVRLIPPADAPATESDEVIPRADENASESDRRDLPMNPKAPAASPSPLPSSPVAQSPGLPVERKSPVWPWVIGILALIVIAALALKRRP